MSRINPNITMSELGRPTVMTPETIARLEDGFIKGLSDTEACLYADIAPSTFYAYCKDNPDFSERKEQLKQNVKLKAKFNIEAEIQKGDKILSQWYLERRDKDFRPKQENEHSGNLTINSIAYDNNNTPQVSAKDLPATSA